MYNQNIPEYFRFYKSDTLIAPGKHLTLLESHRVAVLVI